MSFNVRGLTEADREFFLNASEVFYSLPAVAHPVPADFFVKSFEFCLTPNPYLKGMIIFEGEDKAGYALLASTYSPEAGGLCLWLDEVYILSAFQGRGLGAAFINYLEDEFIKKQGYKRLRLEVSPANPEAMNLYRRQGFQPLEYLQMVKDY